MKVKVNTTCLGCSSEPEIKCPFCGGMQSNSYEYGIGEVECGHCGRTFHASRNIEITYSSSPSADTWDWECGDVFDDGIEDIEEEELANTNGANPCGVVKEEV